MGRWLTWPAAALAAVAGLGACSEDTCFLVGRVVASSTSTEPGTVQSGLLQSTSDGWVSARPPLAVRSDGTVVCVTCTGVVALDPSLRRLGGLDTPGPASVVVARDDSIYAAVPGSDVETTDVVALDPSGQVRWRSTIGTRSTSVALIASDDGLYARAQPFTGASPLSQPTLFAIDPATGAQHGMTTSAHILGPAHRGVIAVIPGDPIVIEQVDITGDVLWSHVVHGLSSDQLTGSLAAADGGAIVFGGASADIDLGDRTIPVARSNEAHGLIIRFDAAGATRWGYSDITGIAAVAVIGDDRFVVTGRRQVGGSQTAPDIDSYLTVATSAGVVRTLAIAGPGIQEILGIASAPDGAAWVQLLSVKSDDERPEPAPVVEIGDRRFTDSGVYLFKIVP